MTILPFLEMCTDIAQLSGQGRRHYRGRFVPTSQKEFLLGTVETNFAKIPLGSFLSTNDIVLPSPDDLSPCESCLREAIQRPNRQTTQITNNNPANDNLLANKEHRTTPDSTERTDKAGRTGTSTLATDSSSSIDRNTTNNKQRSNKHNDVGDNKPTNEQLSE